jgi:hypothetical protein
MEGVVGKQKEGLWIKVEVEVISLPLIKAYII